MIPVKSVFRFKQPHIIPEEAREDEEAKPGDSEEDSNEFRGDIKDPKTQSVCFGLKC